MRWRPPKNMQTIKKFYESYEDEKEILPVKKNRGVKPKPKTHTFKETCSEYFH